MEVEGQRFSDFIKTMALSNDTIQRRTSTMALDVKTQIKKAIGKSPCVCISFDESTSKTSLQTLVVYAR